jgi:hypothetical protein
VDKANWPSVIVQGRGMPPSFVPDALRRVPFSTATAAKCGVSRRALHGSAWRNLLREVWVHCEVADSRELRLAAVRLILGPGMFICGPTAAWIYGIDVQDPRAQLVWVGCRTGSRPRARAGCLVREITVDDTDLVLVDGLWMTTPLRTVFDCARWLPLVEGVVVADALARDRLISPEALTAYTASHPGLRGVARARQVIGLCDPKSESPMETRVRVLLVLGGLPRPECQIEFLGVSGVPWARGDMGYRWARVLVEYDGAQHWERRREDDRRRDALRNLGWIVGSSQRDRLLPAPPVDHRRGAARARTPPRRMILTLVTPNRPPEVTSVKIDNGALWGTQNW